ncbi:UDP glycosyltransferase [Micromonospora zingiberis]|uniref:UDP glycosyltransferase n=1 Tax=Micromonospora zingiberis TaxID=2053011 RepID=A0A4R0GTM2_9ACTN|nr:macrolide family glycosyltransferase [Micromonospora zingiberis]TCC00428.1 UDP glycosyltransferase [Micromonospora zingiberis]
MVGCTAPSHIYPSLSLIRELVDRGHRVTYVVGQPLTGLVAPTGAEPIAHPSILPQGDTAWPEDPATAMRVFLDEAIAVLPRLTAHYDADRPDLVLYDIGGLAGPLLGARYGVPAVQLSPTMVAWTGYEQDMADFFTALAASPTGRDYYATFDAWLAANGIHEDARTFVTFPKQVLSLIPRVMQPYADRVPDAVRFVGPCLDPDRLTEPGWAPPTDGRPVLLVSFGTAYNDQLPVYRACLDGIADSPWQVVLAIGDKVDPADLGPLPGNVEVHRRVPQLVVLAHAAAFVTHAGMGGCTEALWFGVPTVAIPQAVDQFGNAQQLVEAGVGRLLPAEEVSAETLRAAVDAVADDALVRGRLTEIRSEVRANGGTGRAADAVEEFLTER